MNNTYLKAELIAGLDLPFVGANIYTLGFDFLLPYLEPFGRFVGQPEEADFILTMNNTEPDAIAKLAQARRWKKPIAWWTIEDPNWFENFLPQAQQADFIFTTDEACIPRYVERLGHHRVFWLPLACSPQFHRPRPLTDGASDFVISANWYTNEARLWGVATVVDPLISTGRTITLFCYKSFMWPLRYQRFWKGETNFRTVAEQYAHGCVVLGLNNQRSGMDGRLKTLMTSMRTFEALACGKPFLATRSDAYEQLGFVHGEHMAWVDRPENTLSWAERLLGADGESIARTGRALVLSRHTYAHRLAHLAEITLS